MTYFDIDSIPSTVNVIIAPRRSGKNTHIQAVRDSLNASVGAMDKSELDMFSVAYAVGMEAAQREAEFAKLHDPKAPAKLKTPALLGCWVNGELKFQSRDHDAIRAYAAEKMRPWTVKTKSGYQVRTNDVWVAPVGSFIDAKQQKKLEESYA